MPIDADRHAQQLDNFDHLTDSSIASYSAQDRLLNGQMVFIRAIKPEDKSVLEDEMRHLSADSKYFRFFIAKRELTNKELAALTELDFVNHVGLLASVLHDGVLTPAGIGRYVRMIEPAEDRKVAELGFEVRDEFQGLGIATSLLKHLTAIARRGGIQLFKAYVMRDNTKMLHVLAHCGLPMRETLDGEGILDIELEL